MKSKTVELLRFIVVILSGLVLIYIGADSLINKTWRFRNGDLSSPAYAEFIGLFIVIVGAILVVVQVWDIIRRQKNGAAK